MADDETRPPMLGPVEMLEKCWGMCTPAQKIAFLEHVRREFLKPAVRVDVTRAEAKSESRAGSTNFQYERD